MSSRTVSVVLSANIANYKANIAAAQKQTEEFAKSSQKTADGLAKQHQAFQQVGTGLVAVGATAAVALAAVVKTTAEFSAKMAQLQTVSKATNAQMNQLRDAALTQGKAFGYTASQVADAQIELAKAGITAKQQLGGALTGALSLAAAGQIEVGKATEIAVTALTDFKLSAKDTGHVADLLASGADKSTASVESIGQALQQSGLVAAQFGLTVEDTVGTLTAFAQAGLQGSDAGTSLKTMLLALASPSKEAQKALDQYNITAYDSQGAFVGVTNLAEQLNTKLHGLSDAQRNAALSTIFGTDAIRSAGVLYDLGGKKLQGFIDANNEAGFASAQAAGKLNSLTGDLQKLNATVQTDMIKAGSGLEGALRGIVQSADSVLTTFGNLPAPIQNTAVVATGLTAGIGLLGGAFLLALPKIAEFKIALSTLGVSGKGALAVFGKGTAITAGITAAISGIANLGTAGIATAEQVNLAGKLLDNGFKNINNSFDAMIGEQRNAKQSFDDLYGGTAWLNSGWAKFLDGATFGITHFSDVFKTNEGQFRAIGEQLKGLAEQDYSSATMSFNQFVNQLGGGTEVAQQALQAFPAYREQIVQLLTATGQAASEQNILAAASGQGGVAGKIREAQAAAASNTVALQAMQGAAADAGGDIKTLADQISGFGSVALDARSANRAFEQAVDDAADAVKKNGRNLNTATAAGRANQASLDGIASAATASAAAILRNSGSAEDAAGALRRGRAAFINAATAMGLSRAAANRLADQLNLIPKNVKTTVSMTGASAAINAARNVGREVKAINNLRSTVYVDVVRQGGDSLSPSTYTRARKAAGGAIYGAGTKGVDSVPALLAPGEHVLTARDVDKMGGQAAVYRFRSSLQAYAAGGAVEDALDTRNASTKAAIRIARQLKAAKNAAKAAKKRYESISRKKADQGRKKAARSRLTAANKRVSKIEKRLGKTKATRDTAKETVTKLREAREDFVSQQRRGVTDPLTYVDQLRSMSRDDTYSKAYRTRFQKTANRYEAAIVKLAKQSADAAEKLNGLKSSADSMRSSITSTIAGAYRIGDAATSPRAAGTITRNGIRLQTYSSSPDAASIRSYYAQAAKGAAQFAAQLKQLAARGVNGRLLAEIAGYGVKDGAPIAAALLTASDSQITAINNNYSSLQKNAGSAANVVTDANYKALIDSAQKNADRITAQLNADAEKLRSLIAKAFGLKGYAAGTSYATSGVHLVGERGPELVTFGGGEQVLDARRTQTWIRGNRYSSGPRPGQAAGMQEIRMHFTDDGSRLGTAMREIAETAISRDQLDDSILMWGGAA